MSEPATAALFRHLPRLAGRVPWMTLGDWPTPLEPLEVDGRPIWVKREGDASARYGGNKVRTLEAWLGHARERGARRIWAMGATGSNHAVATVVHARRAGLDAAAILFPQPESEWADENARTLARLSDGDGCEIVRLPHVALLPFAALAIGRRDRGAIMMPPGGATPLGAFGALSAAFELAEQLAAGPAPAPARIVVPIGSTCTTAGLVAGIALARAVGAWPWRIPLVHAVRVTPWPVTSRLRTAELAARTLARVAALGGPRIALGTLDLARRLVVDRRELGAGYGRMTPAAVAAIAVFQDIATAPRLDGVYSAKAAAALLRLHRAGIGPLLFWSTKSTV